MSGRIIDLVGKSITCLALGGLLYLVIIILWVMFSGCGSVTDDAELDIKNLEAAFEVYHDDFGVYPFENDLTRGGDRELSEKEYYQAIDVLSGKNTSGKVYLSTKGSYLTPWEQCYKIVFDFSNDGKVSEGASEALSEDLELRVGIYCYGGDEDLISSWDD